MDDIETRLKSHSHSLDGLLSLIPADKYYDGDHSNQWNKRKQSKEDAKRAKKARLDPDAAVSAADVRRQKAEEKKKAQREQNADEPGRDMDMMPPPPRPKAKLKKQTARVPSPPPQEDETDESEVEGESRDTSTESLSEKDVDEDSESDIENAENEQTPQLSQANSETSEASSVLDLRMDPDLSSTDSPSSSTIATSSSPSSTTASKPAHPTVDSVTKADHQARLRAKIESLRVARGAKSANGPARNRDELVAIRRAEAANRKDRKKALRLEAKRLEDEARRSASVASSRESSVVVATVPENNFAFGKIQFEDGQEVDTTLHGFKKERRKKGPSDLAGQLKHVEAKKKRIAEMDDNKREAVEEKECWGKALRQVEGVKVKDDERLLKKAVARQQKGKSKSAKEWGERSSSVAKAKDQKQKKREANIQARKDSKGKKGGKKGGPNKKKGRAGFEGSLKAKRK